MEIFEHVGAVTVILQESIKLLPKNGKIMVIITIFSMLLFSVIFLVFYSFKSFFFVALIQLFLPIDDTNFSKSSDLVLLLCCLLGTVFISFFSSIAVIIVSGVSYRGKSLSWKCFLLMVVKSWTRPFITIFYKTLLEVGYFVFVLTMALFLLKFSATPILPVAVAIAAYIFYIYLIIVWILAVVISVIEETNHGMRAIGKADELIKGKRLQGFILNTVLNLLPVITNQGLTTMGGENWTNNQKVFWLFLVNTTCLLTMFQLVGYTVLYFQCKKFNGEEIQLQEIASYKKLSVAAPDDIP